VLSVVVAVMMLLVDDVVIVAVIVAPACNGVVRTSYEPVAVWVLV